MKRELISEKMLKEHGKILKLVNDFVKEKENSYSKLKTLQKKHAYAEEKAIFIFYKDKKEFKLLTTILDQHEHLRIYMKSMQTNRDDVKKFEMLMKEHIQLEDSKFYPMLDKDLSAGQQEKVMEDFDVLMK